MSAHTYLLSFVGVVRTVSDQEPDQSRRNINGAETGTLQEFCSPHDEATVYTSVGILAYKED